MPGIVDYLLRVGFIAILTFIGVVVTLVAYDSRCGRNVANSDPVSDKARLQIAMAITILVVFFWVMARKPVGIPYVPWSY